MTNVAIVSKAVVIGVFAVGIVAVFTGRLELLAVTVGLPFLFIAVTHYRAMVVATTWALLIFESRLPVALFGFTYFSYVVYFVLGSTLIAFLAWVASPGKQILAREIWIVALFVIPVTIGALRGVGHVNDIPAHMLDAWYDVALDSRAYLRTFFLMPMFQPLLAVLVAGAIARGLNPMRLLKPGLVLVWLLFMILGANMVAGEVSLSELAYVAEAARDEFLSSDVAWHANHVGLYGAFIYALLLGMMASVTRRLRRFFVATMAIAVVLVFLSFSRSAVIALVAVNILYFWKAGHWTKWLLVMSIAIAWAILPDEIFSRFRLGMDTGDVNVFTSGRIENIWIPLVQDVLNSFVLGQGHYSVYWTHAQQAGLIYPVVHSHNALIDLLLDYGVLGAAPILIFYAYVWRKFFNLSKIESIPVFQGIFYGGHLAMVVLLATIFNGRLTPQPTHLPLWITIGIMFGRLELLKMQSQPRSAGHLSC